MLANFTTMAQQIDSIDPYMLLDWKGRGKLASRLYKILTMQRQHDKVQQNKPL